MKKLGDELTKEYMAKLEAFNLSIQQKMNSYGYSGIRKSRSKGSSMEFSDFRDYTAGDDLRRVDWNGYARFDRLFIKLFMEEKQASVNIFVDTSLSMFEREEKAFFSKMVAASISYIALKNTDKVSVFACGEEINAKKMGVQSKNEFINIIEFLDDLKYDSRTKLAYSISKVRNENIGRGISIILSDFFSEDGYEEAVKELQSKKQDIILVQILSKDEIEPEYKGSIRLVDSETKEHMDIEITPEVVGEYKNALKNYENQIREFCFKRGAKFATLTSEMSVLKAMGEIL